ncbi:MAG: GtrA family protein [Oscillospiraceae bacterium]|nr:GtrA family protein [Oscillospiraceae bacterium]
MKEAFLRLWNGKYGEFVRYVAAGCVTTATALIVFQTMCIVFGVDPKAPNNFVTLANVISIVTATIVAYIVNKLIVFRNRDMSAKRIITEFAAFCLGRGFTMLLEVGGVYLMVNVMGQYPIMGKIESEIIVIICNYLISKFVVFRKRKT